MRFLDEITWLLLPNFVMRRFAYKMSWFLAVVRCRCEICRVWLHRFVMRYPDETSFFLAIMIFLKLDCMLFAAHCSYEIYPDEMSCFFGPLRALRMRYHNACLSVTRYLDEIACFLAAEYSF